MGPSNRLNGDSVSIGVPGVRGPTSVLGDPGRLHVEAEGAAGDEVEGAASDEAKGAAGNEVTPWLQTAGKPCGQEQSGKRGASNRRAAFRYSRWHLLLPRVLSPRTCVTG